MTRHDARTLARHLTRLTLLSGDALLLLQYFCGGLYAIISRRIVAGIAPLILCAIQFAAGSLFVFKGPYRAVLINYLGSALKEDLIRRLAPAPVEQP